MIQQRTVMSEKWWRERTCPIKSTHLTKAGIIGAGCDGSHCALWRETSRASDGSKRGICTL